MTERDVVLMPFQQMDGKTKIRPAIVFALLPKSEFLSVIGSISPERHVRLLRRLTSYLLEAFSAVTDA